MGQCVKRITVEMLQPSFWCVKSSFARKTGGIILMKLFGKLEVETICYVTANSFSMVNFESTPIDLGNKCD